jgi:hypothetical protein
MRPLLAAALLFLLAASPAAAQDLIARDAKVVALAAPAESRTFALTEADGRAGTSTWRMVQDTGNCCETYVTTSSDGRIFDFGGSYLNFSADRGETWQQVRGDVPIVTGEGAIGIGPDGDVLGVGWDPYGGDSLSAWHQDSATGKWRWAAMPLHTPFYDREWLAVVPGPITIGGDTFPWVSFVKGGSAEKEEYLYSTDGVTYTGVTSKFLDATVNGGRVSGPLPVTPSPAFDWIQGHTSMGVTALGAGAALAAPETTFGNDYSLLDPSDLTWNAYSPSQPFAGTFQSDSRGYLHNVVADGEPNAEGTRGGGFEYRLSTDRGVTWRAVDVPLPKGMQVEESDFRVHGGLGIAAVAIHAHDNAKDVDRDLLYKLDVRGAQPALLRGYEIGDDPMIAGQGVASTDTRFDFASVAILPDGGVVMSFLDKATGGQPAIAIELSEPMPPHFAESPLPATGPVAGPATPVVGPGPGHADGGAAGGGAGGDRAVDAAGPPGGAHRVVLVLRRRGARVIASGEVLPRHPGHVVRLQIRRGTRWVTLARVKLTARSTFKRTLRLRGRATLRAVASADGAGHRAGRSRPVTVRR